MLLPCEVQQRGIAATQEILTALLDGVESDNGKGQQAKVHILDILPNRPGSLRCTMKAVKALGKLPRVGFNPGTMSGAEHVSSSRKSACALEMAASSFSLPIAPGMRRFARA